MKHLTKLFDSLAKLKLEKDSAGTELKSANGMWSKDGEYVALAKSCDLQGQVSCRGKVGFMYSLLRITDQMRCSD